MSNKLTGYQTVTPAYGRDYSGLTFRAWDTVMRELQERREQLLYGPVTVDTAARLVDVNTTIAGLRAEWKAPSPATE